MFYVGCSRVRCWEQLSLSPFQLNSLQAARHSQAVLQRMSFEVQLLQMAERTLQKHAMLCSAEDVTAVHEHLQQQTATLQEVLRSKQRSSAGR